jgi:peptidoglycan/xylan/chitin deacetylase (PgdA/CDA1 family)/glycosyltransferase involved in cell wall biosynthesis
MARDDGMLEAGHTSGQDWGIVTDATRPTPAPTERIGLSIVIPTFGRCRRLARLLAELELRLAGDAGADVEVIVVDDGSTDGTAEFLAAYRPTYRLRAITQANGGQPSALNHGLRLARGTICLFLDDDVLPGPGLIAAHREAQDRTGGAVVIGRLEQRGARGSDWIARTFAERWRAHQDRLESGELAASFTDCYSGNLSVPTAVTLDAGGFDETLARSFDVELAMRLAKRRLSIVYAADAVGHHDDEKDGLALLRDAEREGAAGVELARRFPDVISALRLGSFGEGGLRPFLLRRMLLWLRVPPGLLASLGTLAGRRRRLAWFRFVHAFAYWTGVRRTVDRSTWNALTTGVTILMYHAIGGDGDAPSRYIVPIGRFQRQIRWLRLLRYRVVTVAQLAEWRRDGVAPPRRCVVVTFDDGYADNLDLAAPVLRRARLRATLYIVAGAHDRNDWDEVGELARRPIAPAPAFAAEDAFEIGVHSMGHRPLIEMDAVDLEAEVVESKAILEQELGRPMHTFAYPYGAADEHARLAVERAGYLGACGVRDGPVWPGTASFELNRTEVWGTDGLAHFALAVATGYGRPFRRARRT